METNNLQLDADYPLPLHPVQDNSEIQLQELQSALPLSPLPVSPLAATNIQVPLSVVDPVTVTLHQFQLALPLAPTHTTE